MHIVLVNRWYPPESHGGVAMHNSQFAEACTKLGHQVTVITQSQSGQNEIAEINGVTVYRVSSPNYYRYRRLPILGKHYHFLHILTYSWAVNKILRSVHTKKAVDLVEYADINAEGFFWPRIGRLVVRCHTPVFVLAKYYTNNELPYDPILPSWAEKRVIRRAAVVTTPSEDLAKIIRAECQISADKVVAVPNAVDIERFTPSIESTKQDVTTILHVGRMERGKGIDTLVGAIPQVCDQLGSVRFVFVGGDRPREDGSSTQSYIEQVLAKYIGVGQVKIYGSVPDADLVRIYQNADVCVVPSMIYESFSYTVAQAMACGLPVVASRIGGIPETINENECGLLVEPGNFKELAEALIYLINNPLERKRLGHASRLRAEKFQTTDVSKRILTAYSKDL